MLFWGRFSRDQLSYLVAMNLGNLLVSIVASAFRTLMKRNDKFGRPWNAKSLFQSPIVHLKLDFLAGLGHKKPEFHNHAI